MSSSVRNEQTNCLNMNSFMKHQTCHYLVFWNFSETVNGGKIRMNLAIKPLISLGSFFSNLGKSQMTTKKCFSSVFCFRSEFEDMLVSFIFF